MSVRHSLFAVLAMAAANCSVRSGCDQLSEANQWLECASTAEFKQVQSITAGDTVALLSEDQLRLLFRISDLERSLEEKASERDQLVRQARMDLEDAIESDPQGKRFLEVMVILQRSLQLTQALASFRDRLKQDEALEAQVKQLTPKRLPASASSEDAALEHAFFQLQSDIDNAETLKADPKATDLQRSAAVGRVAISLARVDDVVVEHEVEADVENAADLTESLTDIAKFARSAGESGGPEILVRALSPTDLSQDISASDAQSIRSRAQVFLWQELGPHLPQRARARPYIFNQSDAAAFIRENTEAAACFARDCIGSAR